jgi:hypothetical protein
MSERTNNRLLAALSPTDFAELSDDLHPVALPKKQVVYEVGKSSIMSILSRVDWHQS